MATPSTVRAGAASAIAARVAVDVDDGANSAQVQKRHATVDVNRTTETSTIPTTGRGPNAPRHGDQAQQCSRNGERRHPHHRPARTEDPVGQRLGGFARTPAGWIGEGVVADDVDDDGEPGQEPRGSHQRRSAIRPPRRDLRCPGDGQRSCPERGSPNAVGQRAPTSAQRHQYAGRCRRQSERNTRVLSADEPRSGDRRGRADHGDGEDDRLYRIDRCGRILAGDSDRRGRCHDQRSRRGQRGGDGQTPSPN